MRLVQLRVRRRDRATQKVAADTIALLVQPAQFRGVHVPSSRDLQQQAQPYVLRVSQLLAFAAALAPLVQQVQLCAVTRHLSS